MSSHTQNYLKSPDNIERQVFSNGVNIRKLKTEDKDSIKQLLERVSQFTEEERNCAFELMDISLGQAFSSPLGQASRSPLGQDEEAGDYEFLVAVDGNDKLYGFISFGDISLTDACYDLYWIVCDPAAQNKGIGTILLNRLEKLLKSRGIRKLFAETSSQELYVSAHNFYKKRGFDLVARIPDFYKKGDDKLIYVKNL